MLANMITLAASPVFTRLFTPAEMGLAAMLFNLSTLLAVGAACKLDNALMIADAREAPGLFRGSVWGIALVGTLSLPLGWWLQQHQILGFEQVPSLFLWVLPALVVIRGMLALLRAELIRVDGSLAIARCVIWGAMAMVLTRLLAGWLGAGVPGILASEVFGVLVSTVLLFAHAKQHGLWRAPRADGLRAVLKKYWRFPALELPGSWLDMLAFLLVLPMIADLFGPAEAGLFGLAMNLVMLVNRHLGRAVSDVFFQRVGEVLRVGDRSGLQALFIGTLLRLLMIALLVAGVLVALVPEVFGWVFGQRWAGGGDLVALLAPFAAMALIVSPLSRVLSALHRQALKLIYDVGSLLSVVGLYYWAQQGQPGLHDFVLVFSVVGVLTYLLYLILIFWAVFIGQMPAVTVAPARVGNSG